MNKCSKLFSILTAVAPSATIFTTSALAYSTGTYRVLYNGTNIRSAASLQSSIVTRVNSGTSVTVSKVSGEWGYIPSLNGWLRLNGFATYTGSANSSSSSGYKTGTYRVLYNGTNIRSAASLQSSIVTRVNSGTSVTVSKVSGEWGYIPSLNGWLRLNGFATYIGSASSNSSTNQTSSDQASLMVSKALAHVGYLETTYSNGAFWSKFGSWYGNQVGDSGFAYGPWCAMYISYVANEAGVSRDVIPLFASCSVGKNWFESRGRFHYRSSGYTPKKGDLIFFNGHVGLVTDVSGNTVYTVEGNVHNGNYQNYGVRKLSYNKNSSSIIGYASPAYR